MDTSRYLHTCFLLLALVDFSHSQCTDTNKNQVQEDLPEATYEPQNFNSPGYPTTYYSNMDCRWKFSTPLATDKVVVDIRKYYIEGGEGDSCFYDFIQFYDGDSANAEPISTLCNVQLSGAMIVSSGQYGLLQLKSDFSVQYAGFELRYLLGREQLGGGATDCSAPIALTATTTKQYFTSRGWPELFDRAEVCNWIIQSAAGTTVEMEIIYSALVSGEECYSDHLRIFDGTNTPSILTDQCDNREYFPTDPNNLVFRTTVNRAGVEHVALQSGYRRRGFVLAYTEIPSGITTTPVPSTTTRTVASSCSGATVSLTATDTPQFITTPDYPIFYSPNENCKWLLRAPTGSIIQMKVLDSFLEDSEGCAGDRVTVYDGLSTEFPVLASFCGEAFSDVNSTSNEMLITFFSDGSYQERGFSLQFLTTLHTTPSCVDSTSSTEFTNLTATSDPQYFTSPNYPDNYNGSVVFHWLIHNPTDTGVIILETVDSRLEANPTCAYDSVRIYKGPCSTYPQLGQFCGAAAPTYTQNTGAYALVIFTSDANTHFRGFRMKYYVTEEEDEGPSVFVIVGLVVGVVIGVLALIGIIIATVCAIRKKEKPSRSDSMSSLASSEAGVATTVPRPGTSKGRKKHKQLPPLKAKTKLPELHSISRKFVLPSIKKS